MNHWRTNEQMIEWIEGWVGGWMDERVSLLVSYFLTERPLCWHAPSLSYFFSEQPLILLWPVCQLALLQLLQPDSSLRAAVTMFSNLQLQSRIAQEYSTSLWSRTTSRAAVRARLAAQLQSRLPGASQHHSSFPACSSANAFCHSRLTVAKHSRGGQCSRTADNVRTWQFFAFFF